ncbi:Aquaporin-9 [Zancudomyces culisetae]|uniref:Aquaporin-9 n=1 Tax=Zancudomyces culisetae TaxID=1213189 RepID=A0A1R1PJG5_ZANCU|nr:Aquaporin-9 [Zancudomyces culisetae]|eukprot:OMH81121.1 Aquaporin-9 [Zancudomyces culisetae]
MSISSSDFSATQRGEQTQIVDEHQIRRFGFYKTRTRIGPYAGEFIGTFMLCFFGTSGNASVVFNDKYGGFGWLIVCLSWSLGIILGLYASISVSGGHINPAITLTKAIYGDFPWKKTPFYIICQVLGGFCGAAVTYGLYASKFSSFNNGVKEVTGPNATAGIFGTYPTPSNTNIQSFFTEMMMGVFLMFFIRAIFDNYIQQAVGIEPIAIGLVLFAIAITIGPLTGFAINPARDFGPRFFTLIAGWGGKVFTANSGYFWIPIVAPCVGVFIGYGLYEIFIIPQKFS